VKQKSAVLGLLPWSQHLGDKAMNDVEIARKEVNTVETTLVQLVQAQQLQRSDFVEMCLCLDAVKRSLNTLAIPSMITGKLIHEAFQSASSTCRSWIDLTPTARKTYSQMATHLNTLVGLPQPCPFCAFYEVAPRPVSATGTIGDIAACDDCVGMNKRADITEMLLQWLEEQS
jgi:hypothetical protein